MNKREEKITTIIGSCVFILVFAVLFTTALILSQHQWDSDVKAAHNNPRYSNGWAEVVAVGNTFEDQQYHYKAAKISYYDLHRVAQASSVTLKNPYVGQELRVVRDKKTKNIYVPADKSTDAITNPRDIVQGFYPGPASFIGAVISVLLGFCVAAVAATAVEDHYKRQSRLNQVRNVRREHQTIDEWMERGYQGIPPSTTRPSDRKYKYEHLPNGEMRWVEIP